MARPCHPVCRQWLDGEGDRRLLRLEQFVYLTDNRFELGSICSRQPLHGAGANIADLPAEDAERTEAQMDLDGRRKHQDEGHDAKSEKEI